MSRSYNKVRPHKNYVYSSVEVIELYDISPTTLSNWVSQGLRYVEGTRPHLFKGQELIRFHQDRRQRGRIELQHGEFKCMSCKAAVLPEPSAVTIAELENSQIWKACSHCPDCGARIFKQLGETECDTLKKLKISNTSWPSRGEANGQAPAGVVVSDEEAITWNPVNEKLVYDWLAFAGKYARSTRIGHLADIRRFEEYIGRKSFTETTVEDAAGYRDRLVEGVRGTGDGNYLAASTVRHTASYLVSFFEWLSTHRPSAQLNRISCYFALPKALKQTVKDKRERVYVPLSQAVSVLDALPSETLINRRDRAIYALAYIGGLRESALISLRLRHVDVLAKVIDHNGRELRAKNGKSFEIFWFPGTEHFQPTLVNWIQELLSLGAGPNDALFPDSKTLGSLKNAGALVAKDREIWAPMKSAHAVDTVFRVASSILGTEITPHSARHTIAQFGEQVCVSYEERKAWSLNLGHEQESTTYRNYGKMTADRREQIISKIDAVDKAAVGKNLRKRLEDVGAQLVEIGRELSVLERDNDDEAVVQ